MDTNVSTIQGGAALFGFGYALLLSSTFKRITNITTKLGYEDNAKTNITITSKHVNIKLFDYKAKKMICYNHDPYINIRNKYVLGVWTLSFFLGSAVGSTLSGFLVDAYGFEWTTVVFFAIYCIILVADLFELSFNLKQSRHQPSYEQITDAPQRSILNHHSF